MFVFSKFCWVFFFDCFVKDQCFIMGFVIGGFFKRWPLNGCSLKVFSFKNNYRDIFSK